MFTSLKIFISSRSKEETYSKEIKRLAILFVCFVSFLVLYFVLQISTLFQAIMLGLSILTLYFIVLSICRLHCIKDNIHRYGHKHTYKWNSVDLDKISVLELIKTFGLPIKIEFLYKDITHLMGKDLVNQRRVYFLDRKEFKTFASFMQAFNYLVDKETKQLTIQSLNDDTPESLGK